MAKKNDTKPAARAARTKDDAETKVSKSPQMSTVLTAPKPDADRAPREDDIGRKEPRETPKDINDQDDGPDKVYGIASRARWGGNPTTAELDAEQAEIDAAQVEE